MIQGMRYLILLLIIVVLSAGATAAEYYVSPDGDDGNPGTVVSPLRTIQAGISRLQPGDVLHLLPGVYRQSAGFIRSGSAGNPITVRAEPGTVLIDGSEEISGEWTLSEGEIYRTQITGPVKQLFFRDTMLVEARWPNMHFPGELWNRSVWATADNGSSLGTMKDAALAATGIDWTGALAVLNIEAQFWTWTSEVTSHSTGSDHFSYRTDNLAGIRSNLNFNDDSYYLTGNLEALDVPGEWYFDPENGYLYVYRPGGGPPQAGELKLKRSDYGITAGTKNYIRLSGLDFFACTFRFDNCDHCVIEKCNLNYPAYSREIPERIVSGGSAPSTLIKGSHNVIRECHIAYSSGNGLQVKGSYNLVENNLVHDVCWSGTLDYKAISSDNSGSNTLSHNNIRMNTVYNGGNSLLGFSGPYDIVELNHVYRGGLLCKDVSLIYTVLPRCEHSQVRKNWVHNVHPPHIALGIRGDDKTRRLNVYRNVVWDIGWEGILVKGDENRIYNNTTFDCDRAGIYLQTGLEPSKPWHDHIPEVMANENSFTYNNLVENMYGNRFEPKPPSGDVSNNREEPGYFGLLVNRVAYDFRPRLASGLVNGGDFVPGVSDPTSIGLPDIGAYEYSDTCYWIPGHRSARASFPIPANHSQVASDIIDLMWKEAYGASSHDVYFGTSRTAIRDADRQSAEFAGNLYNNIFIPPDLAKDSTYFWRVDAVYNDSTVKGEVWDFTVLSNDRPVIYRVDFSIYGVKGQETIPLEGVEISAPGMRAISDAEGKAAVFKQSAGWLTFSLFKKGYLFKSDSILVLTDSLVRDTLQAAVHAYDLTVKVTGTDTGKPLSRCHVQLNDIRQESDSLGKVLFSDLSYGFYHLEAEAEGYSDYTGGDSIELFSDSTIIVSMIPEYIQLQVQVSDRTTGEGIYRAVITARQQLYLTGPNGTTGISCSEGALPIRTEHPDYFTRDDTLFLSGDSAVVLQMTRKRANLEIRVLTDAGAVAGAGVVMNGMTRQTGSEGEAFFLNIPAREIYRYSVNQEGYLEQSDSLYLEVDTVATITLQPLTSGDGVDRSLVRVYPNPVKERLHIQSPSPGLIRLVDLCGRPVLEKMLETEKEEIMLNGLPAGIYFLQLSDNGNKLVFKILKTETAKSL